MDGQTTETVAETTATETTATETAATEAAAETSTPLNLFSLAKTVREQQSQIDSLKADLASAIQTIGNLQNPSPVEETPAPVATETPSVPEAPLAVEAPVVDFWRGSVERRLDAISVALKGIGLNV